MFKKECWIKKQNRSDSTILEYNAVNEKIALDDIKVSSQRSLFYELIVFCVFQLEI